MKREIKFRAWNTRDKKWMHINLRYALESEVKSWTNLEWYQYTGKKDKNGKEIYEGDIVEVGLPDNKARWIVVWDEGSAKFDLEWSGAKRMIKELEGRTYRLPEYSMRLLYGTEVIGNIYENKELLNE